MTPEQIAAFERTGVWPPGVPLPAITSDGAALTSSYEGLSSPAAMAPDAAVRDSLAIGNASILPAALAGKAIAAADQQAAQRRDRAELAMVRNAPATEATEGVASSAFGRAISGDTRTAERSPMQRAPSQTAAPLDPSTNPAMTRPTTGAPTGPVQDMAPPRVGGGGGLPNLSGLRSQLDASNRRVQDSLRDADNAFSAAGQENQDAAWGVAATQQNAIDEATAARQAETRHREAAMASMKSVEAEARRRMDEIKDVDPDRYFKEKGAGSRIILGLGAALGAFAANMPGGNGVNHAHNIIQEAVRNDIKAQESNRDKEWNKITKGLEMGKDAFSREMWKADKMLQDEAFAWRKADKIVAGYQTRLQSAEQQARIGEIRAGITGKIEGIEQQMIAGRMQAAAAAAGGGGGNPTIARLEKMHEKALEKWHEGGQQGPAPRRDALYAAYTGKAAPTSAAAPSNPMAAVPKDERPQAIKEQEEFTKADKAADTIDDFFDDWAKTGATNPRQLKSIRANIAAAAKKGAGPGIGSDKDMEEFVFPNAPQIGDSAETLAVKRKNMRRALHSTVATPTLDRHSPNWRPAPRIQERKAPK